MIRRLRASLATLVIATGLGACLGGPQTDPPGDRAGIPDASLATDAGPLTPAPDASHGGAADAATGSDSGPSQGFFDTDTAATPGARAGGKLRPYIFPPPWLDADAGGDSDAGSKDGARD